MRATGVIGATGAIGAGREAGAFAPVAAAQVVSPDGRRIDGRSRNAVVRSLSSVSSERVFRESGTRDMCRVVALCPC